MTDAEKLVAIRSGTDQRDRVPLSGLSRCALTGSSSHPPNIAARVQKATILG